MNHPTNCEGISRRSCLQLGLGALGGGLVNVLRMQADAAAATKLAPPDTRCILIWLVGWGTVALRNV